MNQGKLEVVKQEMARVNVHILGTTELKWHLTRLLRNLYAGQEATVRTGHGTTDWFQIGKGVHQVYIVALLI